MTDPNPALAEFLHEGARAMRERADKIDADAAEIGGENPAAIERVVADIRTARQRGADDWHTVPLRNAEALVRLLDERDTEIARLQAERAKLRDLLDEREAVLDVMRQARLYITDDANETIRLVQCENCAALTAAAQSALEEAAQWHREQQAICYRRVDAGDGNPVILGAHAAAHGEAAAYFSSLLSPQPTTDTGGER